MSNESAFAKLREHTARVKELGTLVSTHTPVEVAEVVEEFFEDQIKSGLDPDGKPWQKRQDGGQPLQNAAKALTVVPVGTTIFARLKGHVAMHHRGLAKGGIVRQIFPTRGIPRKLADKIKTVVTAQFNEIMGK